MQVNVAYIVAGAFLFMTMQSIGHASTIYDNDLTPEETSFFSFSFTSTSTGGQFQVADDFILASEGQGWLVSGASWTGSILVDRRLTPTVGVELSFDVLILPDAGSKPSGTPLDPLPGTALASRSVTAVGTGTSGGIRAEFEADFVPIKLAADTRYWLVVTARGDFSFDELTSIGSGWAWGGRSGTGNAWQGGTDFVDTWIPQGRQQQFRLFGSVAVSEPATVALISFGYAGFFFAVRRRADG